jgi:hypothetical protein
LQSKQVQDKDTTHKKKIYLLMNIFFLLSCFLYDYFFFFWLIKKPTQKKKKFIHYAENLLKHSLRTKSPKRLNELSVESIELSFIFDTNENKSWIISFFSSSLFSMRQTPRRKAKCISSAVLFFYFFNVFFIMNPHVLLKLNSRESIKNISLIEFILRPVYKQCRWLWV